MTILSVNRKEFEKRVGKVTPELEKLITDMGTPIEEVSDKEVSVEVFPNRPDLLSLENFARAVNQFNGKSKVASFKINAHEKDYVVSVDKSVKAVRKHTVCAIVKELKFDDAKIKEVVDIQEKLHNSLGRKRKKLAIGIYPLNKVSLPIRFLGRKPEEIKFLPLEARAEMTGRQILRSHPAGREYADLLKDEDVFPIFIDANDEILSMPPIINSEKTGRVDENTKDIFIECSGNNLSYLKKCLNIIVAALSEMGGKIYLGRMGIGFENRKGKFVAMVPAYRTDILHWIDLTEEIAIAYGYENFEPEIPEISTIAEENPVDRFKRTVGNVLAGLGLLETSSFHLTTKKNIKKMHYDFNEFIELEDSKTERDVLRMDMMTNLLQIASENSDASYPQKTFEMGRVFELGEGGTGVLEKENLGILLVDEKVNFTEMKQVLDYLFKMLGVEYSIEPVDDSNYIIGRCGKIVVPQLDSQGHRTGQGKDIGLVGEVAPRVLKNWKIRMPAVACELEIKDLI
jgi:phenylalanyl-tRNA synthetase beta chain